MAQNNFAAALSGTKPQGSASKKGPASFAEALSGGSGSMPFHQNNSPDNDIFNQHNETGFSQNSLDFQSEQLKRQEYERKRLELHKKVNPVDQKDIFDAREKATKKKIESIRKELKVLSSEIKKFHKEIDIVLMGRVTNPGLEGTGDENFYDKLRAFIILMTQRVRSARSWAQQTQKKNNKKAKKGKGLGKQMVESSGFEQRGNMEQFFNNERGDNWGE